ncbi:hypothetical protein ACFS5L_18605 [Streptomyces phyllanthi]|nr:hypothetical protein [Streptomyces phyllanthi]
MLFGGVAVVARAAETRAGAVAALGDGLSKASKHTVMARMPTRSSVP